MSLTFLIFLIIATVIICIIIAQKTNKNRQQAIAHQPQAINKTSKKIALNTLPNAFQQIIVDIETQFSKIVSLHTADQIDSQLWLNAEKLFYQRLPEIIEDYMALEDIFARNTIIDHNSQLTSYDIALNQIKSIMGYFHQINSVSNNKHLQKILINQRYLTSLYAHAGVTDHLLDDIDVDQHNSIDFNTDQQDFLDSDYVVGQDYLDNYCTLIPDLTKADIAEIGKFVYLASITQIAVQDYLENELSKLNISSEYGLQSLEILLLKKIPKSLKKIKNNPDIKHNLFAQLTTIYQLLEQMMKVLDKNIRIDLKLNQLQDIDDEIWKVVKT